MAKPALNVDLMLKIIPDFNGNSNDLHKFLSCCDVVYSPLEAEADFALFLNVLKSKFSGPAYNLVKYKDYTKWSELKSDLKLKFADSRSIEHLQVELVQAKQLKSEDIRNFATRIETLLSNLNDVCIEREGKDAAKHILSLNNTTALRSFQDGLIDPLKIIIKACRFTNLKDAIAKAIEEENSIRETNSYIPRFTQPIKKTIVKCQLCHKMGHTANVCYSFNRRPPIPHSITTPNPNHNNYGKFSNQSFSANPRVRQFSIICAYCKNAGHNISQCRKKKFNDAARTAQYGSTYQGNPIQSSPNKPSENLMALEQPSTDTSGRVKVKDV